MSGWRAWLGGHDHRADPRRPDDDPGNRLGLAIPGGNDKAPIGPRSRTPDFAARQTGATIGRATPNRMLATDARIPSAANRSPHSNLRFEEVSLSGLKYTNAIWPDISGCFADYE
jgi:hypothetical protein